MINTTFESIERKKFFAFQQFSFNKQLSKVVFNIGRDLNSVRRSRGTKVEKMLTLAPERYTAGFCMVAKVILWCI